MRKTTTDKLFNDPDDHYRILWEIKDPLGNDLTCIQAGDHCRLAIVQEYGTVDGFTVFTVVPGNSVQGAKEALGLS